MKRFHFPLEAVRELRHTQEQAAQKAFADAVRACEAVAMRLLVIDRDLQGVWQGLRNNLLGGMRVDELRHARAWCCALEDRQKQVARDLATYQKDVDTRHAELGQAARRREAMDRLFRKHRHAYGREELVEEQKFLDEIATRASWQAPQLETA